MLKDKIFLFSSFMLTEDRAPICEYNLNKTISEKPKDIEFYIQDSSDENFRFCEKLKLDDLCFYENKKLNFLNSWKELLQKKETSYCLSIFDDFMFFGLDEKAIENGIKLLDSDHTIDCILIDYYPFGQIDEFNKKIKIDSQIIAQKNQNPNVIEVVEVENSKFNIHNNDNAQFCYSWFMNTAIFRREKYLESINFFSSRFTNPHQAELNFHTCPDELKFKKVATFHNASVGMVDLGFAHSIGIRDLHSDTKKYFDLLLSGYSIENKYD